MDPPPVALLKRAGAVPLGSPNTSELCMWSESHHHLDGIPRDPHHLERVPGGSSGLCTHSHCNMFAHTQANTHITTCLHARTQMHTHTHTHAHECTHTNAHTHTHTHYNMLAHTHKNA